MPIGTKLAIRLALHGCTNRPFYHIVVALKHKARNTRPVEQLGTYDPLPNKHGEKLVAISYDRLQYWLGKKAEPTMPVLKLLGLSGFFPLHPMTYIEAKRNRARAAEKSAQQTESADLETTETTEAT